jgi:Zn-finger nucleic acid-binding protein
MGQSANLCCVKCNSILDRAAFQGLEVDLCPKCGGLWLDRGEITQASKLPETELSRLRELLRGQAGPPPVPTENKAPCPACEGNLSEVLLGTVHVDYCATCHGIFLDRGELHQAIEAVRARGRDTTPSQVLAAAISAASQQMDAVVEE